jgi:DNA-binding protein HU-beta
MPAPIIVESIAQLGNWLLMVSMEYKSLAVMVMVKDLEVSGNAVPGDQIVSNVRIAKKKDSFVLPGFGMLSKVNRKARKGRNPAIGEEIKIPAKTVVKFRLVKACKDAIVPPKK